MMAGYMGRSARFDEAVGAFAEAYADQTELDWKQLVQSLRKTRKLAGKNVVRKKG
jgi:hypothetical protein